MHCVIKTINCLKFGIADPQGRCIEGVLQMSFAIYSRLLLNQSKYILPVFEQKKIIF